MKRFEGVNRRKLAREILVPAFDTVLKERFPNLKKLPAEAYSYTQEKLKALVSSSEGLSDEDKNLITLLASFAGNTAKKIEDSGNADDMISALQAAYRVIADFSLSKETMEKYCRDVDKELWITDFTRNFRNTDWKRGIDKQAEPAFAQSRIGEGRRGVCDYQSCRKDAQVYKCEYCGNYYCKDHFTPKPPKMPEFSPKTYEQRMMLEKWADSNGHTCPPSYEDAKKFLDAEEAKFNRAVGDLIARANPEGRRVSTAEPAAASTQEHAKTHPEGLAALAKRKEPTPKREIPKTLLIFAVLFVAMACTVFLLYFAVFSNFSGKANTPPPFVVVTTTTQTTSTTTTTEPTTSTTLKPAPPGCWSFCQKINPSYKGACMRNFNECKSFEWSYMKDGNRDCPRNSLGVETFCCCGENPKFLTLLGDETVPRKGDPTLAGYV